MMKIKFLLVKKKKKIDISSLNKKKIYSQEPEEINDNPKKNTLKIPNNFVERLDTDPSVLQKISNKKKKDTSDSDSESDSSNEKKNNEKKSSLDSSSESEKKEIFKDKKYLFDKINLNKEKIPKIKSQEQFNYYLINEFS